MTVTAGSLLTVDPGSACSRAYYAMFHAVRAALIEVGEVDRAKGKTHSGIRAAFSEFLVKPDLLSVEHSRALGQVEHDRMLADHLGDELTEAEARQAIDQAKAFIAAVHEFIAARTI